MMRLPQRLEVTCQLNVPCNRFAMTTNRHCEERNGVERRRNPIIQRGNLYDEIATAVGTLIVN